MPMTTSWLEQALRELRVPDDHAEVLERLLAAAGSRAADALQTFALRLLEARESGASDPAAVALAAARRWLRRERIDDSILRPLTIPDADSRERERHLEPLPVPAPQVRRQLRWGRRDGLTSIPVQAPDPLREAIRGLPTPERRAINALFGITGPARRGRRSRELLRLAELALERLRQVLPREHFAAKLF